MVAGRARGRGATWKRARTYFRHEQRVDEVQRAVGREASRRPRQLCVECDASREHGSLSGAGMRGEASMPAGVSQGAASAGGRGGGTMSPAELSEAPRC